MKYYIGLATSFHDPAFAIVNQEGELIFAEDFYERKFGERKVGRLTELLRGAEVLSLNEVGREYPEGAAVTYFEEGGAEAYHAENLVWSQLFGIVFWDVLFGTAKITRQYPKKFGVENLPETTVAEQLIWPLVSVAAVPEQTAEVA